MEENLKENYEIDKNGYENMNIAKHKKYKLTKNKIKAILVLSFFEILIFTLIIILILNLNKKDNYCYDISLENNSKISKKSDEIINY